MSSGVGDEKSRKGKPSWRERMNESKRRHRPRLKDWGRDGFASLRASDFDALSELHASEDIARVRCHQLSVEQFIEEYEKGGKPVVIEDVAEDEGWRAMSAWNLQALRHDRKLKKYTFKCGEDDNGRSIRVRLKHFLKYTRHNVDDSPLYIFDSTFDDDKLAKKILDDYRVPRYFPDDLFCLVGERKRPPYRWFLVGPKRSGTSVHVDPLGTSAWNTVIVGRKRWVLFPPHISKDVVKAKSLYKQGEDDEPVNYFVDIIPRIRRHAGSHVPIIEFIQEPGDTVFVPGGWWHAVINLTDTVAITQNFCSRVNFPQVWRQTRTGRKRMAVRWLSLLEHKEPELARLARKLNEQDGYIMLTKEELKERKRRKKERRHGKRSRT